MRLILSVFTSLICLSVFSQSPEKINYQSIVRDLSGNVIQNQPISLRISILSTSITGSVVYQETFQPTTNDFGLVNIKIGEGAAVVGTMSGVDWSSGPFFLESAVDVSGGSNYTVVSTSQFMSVPYALYANESPLDTNIVQNIVSLQTSNYLDSSAVQNLIDNSSTTNVDSSTVASWGYLDSNSIMIIINNTALDSLGIQNMIDNSITNVDSSTVSSWGYLDSITIQNLINNSVSNVDSSTVANWGYLDSNSIMVLINNNSIDSITVASWGYLDSVSIQNMINNSIVNVDSTSIANFGYVAGPHTIDTDTQLDSTGIALMGYLDSVSIRNMIDSAVTAANFGSQLSLGAFNQYTSIDLGWAPSVPGTGGPLRSTEFTADKDGFFLINLKDNVNSNSMIYTYISDTSNIDLNVLSTADASLSFRFGNNTTGRTEWENILIPYLKGKHYKFELYETENVWSVYFLDIISDSLSSNGLAIDSTTVANWGFNTDSQLDSSGIAALGFVAGSTVDTQIDSTGIAALGYVAGPKTIDTDTDTQLDSAGVAALGYIAGNTDTQIDSAGIASLGYLDSVSIRNMIDSVVGSSGSGSGSSIRTFSYPEGFKGSVVSHSFNNGLYTVPTGKNLYIQNYYSSYSTLKLEIDGIVFWEGFSNFSQGKNTFDFPIIVPSGASVDVPSVVGYSRSINGILTESNIKPLVLNAPNNYSVPSDSILYILNLANTANFLFINGESYSSGNKNVQTQGSTTITSIKQPIIVLPGSIISYTGNINGYLAPIDYFSSSSNSGSGSSTTIDSTTIANLGFVAGNTDTQIDSTGIAALGFVAGSTVDTQIDSTGIANLGYVAGPKTIDTDTDTQLDSAGVAALGFVAGSTVDTQIDSTGIANLGYVAGPKTIDTDTDTQLDSAGVAALGFVAGSTVDTQIDSAGIAALGYVAGSTVDTQIDSTGIAALGYVAGPKTIDTDTQLDSAGVANYGFIDSITVMNMINQYSSSTSSGSGIGGGNSFIFPEGYNGVPITHFFGNGSYTVPGGKSLYVTIRYSTSGDLKINNTTVSSGTNNYGGGSLGLFLPLILNSGDILSSTSSSSSFHGFLVNENLSSITHSFGSSNYTVPADKTLYILNRYSTSGDLKINNTTVSSGTNNYGGGSAGLLLPVIVSPGDIVSSTNSSTSFNGYLADTSYFESSSSNIDSSEISDMGFVDSMTVVNMINSGGGASGKTFNFPEGFEGEGIMQNVFNNPYTVPSGKRLYMTYWNYGSPLVDNLSRVVPTHKPLIINSGQVVSTGSTSAAPYFQGFLVDANIGLTAIKQNVFNNPYTVPSGKRLYMTYWYYGSPLVDNLSRVVPTDKPLIINSGQVVSTGSTSATSPYFQGYIVDEDYFKTESGTSSGSSSSSGSGSNANTLIYTTSGF